VKQSDVMAIVRLIGALQSLAMQRGSVVIEKARNSTELASIQQHVNSLELQSVMAVPLVDGDEHVGILILEQCDRPRKWGPKDVVVSKTIADQMVLAVHNTKLRNLMKTLAVTDEKSGLLKRASYIDVMLSEVKRATQQKSPSTLMLLNFGRAGALTREVGEAGVEGLMQSIGQTICSHIRQTDTAIRYDKTTIALVLGDTNDKNAFFVVEKFRKALATTHVPGTERPIHMAAGIAGIVMNERYDPVDIVTEAINRGEHALEMALTQGPNSAHALAPVGESAAVA
jgi:GGDEF domain-containing protein